ncbi:MAG: DUF4956 domain-containing protein [Erysipelotrichaceae bacterium]|nr:DUF4956 domain-containing protein [Erysipelotrichaceae bacterium]
MSLITDIINSIFTSVGRDVAPLATIIGVLLVTLFMSVYEFVVYRTVSHRAIYNKQFHIAILVIPFFIGSIVMALQSNIVVTLGTIGALAIIRFRTAIKDATDMVYLLWSIFIGITCGCQLYESCILTSLIVTTILVAANALSGKLFRNPYILVVNSKENIEKELKEVISGNTISYRLKSRNYTGNGVDYVYELGLKDPEKLTEEVGKLKNIKQFSLLEYDSNDII